MYDPLNANYPWRTANPPRVQQPQQQVVSPASNRIIVNGIEEARAYHVAPNTTIDMWDANQPIIYMKWADAYGVPYMNILDYKVRGSEQQKQEEEKPPTVSYATKDDVASLRERINALSNKIKELTKTNEPASK